MAEAPNTPIRTVEAQGMPGARVDQTAPISAFGGGEGLAQSTNAIQNLAGQAQDLAVQEIQKQNQVAHLDAMNKAQDLQTKLQIETSKMYGKDAAAAPDVAEKNWQDGVQKIRDGLSNGAQRAMFDRSSSMLWHSLNRSVQTHVSQQMQVYDDQTTSSFIDNSKTAAVLNANDPARVDLELAKQKAALADWAKRKGIPTDSEIFQSKLTDTLSQTHTGVIQSNLDTGNTKAAEAYFAQNKANMSAGDQLKIAKAIEQNKDVSLGLDIYNQVKGMKLSDGRTPDEGKMERSIMESADLSDEKKIRMVQFVKARAREDMSNMYREDNARDRSFMDQAIRARKSGVSMADFMKQVPKYAIDDYDQAQKEDSVSKIWAPAEVKTDPATKVALLDGIDAGSVDKAEIDQAYAKGLLSPNDWVSAREKFRQNVVDGKNPAQQRANEQLKLLAKSRFGGDQDAVNAFLSEIKSTAWGKPPEEMLKIANDKLKQDESTVSRVWSWVPLVGGDAIPFTGQPQYEVDIDHRQKDALNVGRLQQDLGPEVVKAISVSNARLGSKQSPAETVNELSAAFGGYDKLQPGQPAYNAMQSLMNAGKVVNVDSVKKVLEHYPSGTFTAPAGGEAAVPRVGRLPHRGKR